MRALLVSSLLVLSACPWHREGGGVDLVEAPWVAEVDVLWDARGSAAPVRQALDAVLEEDPDSAAARWRMSRLHAREALGADRDTALREVTRARDEALACLEADPVVALRRREVGWGAALEAVGPQAGPCVVWAAWSWTRWVYVFGEDAAHLDLLVLPVFVEHAGRLAASADEVRVVRWTEAMYARIDGDPDTDGEAQMIEVVASRPDDLAARLDLLELIALPDGHHRLAQREHRAILDGTPRTDEDGRAVERARGLN